MRQIVLDTETTGLEPSQDHRIIEIGCVELVNRRLTGSTFHQYLNPERDIDAGAVDVHGITSEVLRDKPRFADIVDDFLTFVEGAELIIHNAPFDVGFVNHELDLLEDNPGPLEKHCAIIDTLMMARGKHPGQKNSLDALCKRYQVDNSNRELHGALLDAQILADVYLLMTGGQTALFSGAGEDTRQGRITPVRRLDAKRPPLKVIKATTDELAAHLERLESIDTSSGGNCLWKQLES